MLPRRLLLWVVLGLVLVVGNALGRPAAATDAQLPAAVTHAAGPATADADADRRPCVLRSECAGAWVFGAGSLVLAVAVAGPTIGTVTTVGRVGSFPQVLTSRLAAARLFRPPQFS